MPDSKIEAIGAAPRQDTMTKEDAQKAIGVLRSQLQTALSVLWLSQAPDIFFNLLGSRSTGQEEHDVVHGISRSELFVYRFISHNEVAIEINIDLEASATAEESLMTIYRDTVFPGVVNTFLKETAVKTIETCLSATGVKLSDFECESSYRHWRDFRIKFLFKSPSFAALYKKATASGGAD